MPHRDFDAVYTGLLAYLNAGAMAVAGESLLTLRWVMLGAVLLWIPAFFAVGRRVAGPRAAALATVLAVALGPAIYPVGMPSWFNLFLATWGLLALVRWDESGRRGWLAAAGACAGVSVLVKIAGLYALAAALFFVLHRELARPDRARAADRDGGPGVAAAATLVVAALVAMEVLLVRSQASPRAWVHYVLPTVAIGVVAVSTAWRHPRPEFPAAARVAGGWSWIVLGFAVPVAAWVVAFAGAGALDDLVRGVFVLPGRRFDSAASLPLPLVRSGWLLLPLGLLLVEPRLSRSARSRLTVAAALVGALVLVASPRPAVYRAVWYALQPLIPLAVAGAAVALLRRPYGLRPTAPEEAVLWTAALFSLVQFPFSGPIYFAYVAPLGVLAALAALAVEPPGRLLSQRPVAAVLAFLWLGFAMTGPDRGGRMGPPEDTPLVRLEGRGGIRVPAPDAREYHEVVTLLRHHGGEGGIYVTPDAPEVYFLTGMANPTRTLFEVFDEPGGRVERVLAALDSAGVEAVVLNTLRTFSEPDMGVIRELEARYPEAVRVGRFIVRWRGAAPAADVSP